MVQYEIDIHNLNKELNQTKDDERKRSDELEKRTVSIDLCFRKNN